MRSKEVRIRLTETELEVLDKLAGDEGKNRSDFIRSRIARPIMDSGEYRRLCADAQKHVGNAIPRLHVESLVSFALSRCLGTRAS